MTQGKRLQNGGTDFGAALAAIGQQKDRQFAKGFGLGVIAKDPALPNRMHQPGTRQLRQMRGQGVLGNFKRFCQLTGGQAIRQNPHKPAPGVKPGGLAKG